MALSAVGGDAFGGSGLGAGKKSRPLRPKCRLMEAELGNGTIGGGASGRMI